MPDQPRVEGPFNYYGEYFTARRADGSYVLNAHGRVHFSTREAAQAALEQ